MCKRIDAVQYECNIRFPIVTSTVLSPVMWTSVRFKDFQTCKTTGPTQYVKNHAR